jgi:hypothetical protein
MNTRDVLADRNEMLNDSDRDHTIYDFVAKLAVGSKSGKMNIPVYGVTDALPAEAALVCR